MKTFHEHVVRMSSAGEGISSGMLWALLGDFAKKPEDFIDLIESSALEGQSVRETAHATEFRRSVCFKSGQRFTEDVRLEHDKRRYVARHSAPGAESEFSIEVAEPEEGSLFLRFKYEETPNSELVPDFVAQLRRQAYEAKDRDLAKRLREKLETAQA